MKRVEALKEANPNELRTAPTTRFSGKVTAHRVVLLVNLEMDRLRAVRGAIEGATLNDVIVSIVSGAMRRYLERKGELPKQSLITAVAVNIRSEAERDQPGNVVALTALKMHSNIADPLQRLKAIHSSAIFSKAYPQCHRRPHHVRRCGIDSRRHYFAWRSSCPRGRNDE